MSKSMILKNLGSGAFLTVFDLKELCPPHRLAELGEGRGSHTRNCIGWPQTALKRDATLPFVTFQNHLGKCFMLLVLLTAVGIYISHERSPSTVLR